MKFPVATIHLIVDSLETCFLIAESVMNTTHTFEYLLHEKSDSVEARDWISSVRTNPQLALLYWPKFKKVRKAMKRNKIKIGTEFRPRAD